jgi:hypothetical protein
MHYALSIMHLRMKVTMFLFEVLLENVTIYTVAYDAPIPCALSSKSIQLIRTDIK